MVHPTRKDQTISTCRPRITVNNPYAAIKWFTLAGTNLNKLKNGIGGGQL